MSSRKSVFLKCFTISSNKIKTSAIIYAKNQVVFVFCFTALLSVIIGFLEPKFWSWVNIFDLLRNYAAWGIFTAAQVVILISGGIDVSFTAIATVAMYLLGLFMVNRTITNLISGIIFVIAIGGALGAINGAFVYLTKVHPVIITIGTLSVYYNLLIHFTRGRWLYNLPAFYLDFGLMRIIEIKTPLGPPTGLSVLTVIWIGIALFTWIWLRYTKIGRELFAIGGNLEAARRLGYSIFLLQLFAYTYAGILSGIGGFVYGAAAQFIQPNAIVGRELDVIAAAILGGASVFGGKGSPLGSILGTLLLGVVRNALILLKIPSYWHSAVVGGIVMIATLFAALQIRYTGRR